MMSGACEMRNELSLSVPLSNTARMMLKFISGYGVLYMGLCAVMHLATLLHWLSFEELLWPLAFGLIPLLLTGWVLAKGNTLYLYWKQIMKCSPVWMRRLSVFLQAYIFLLLLWQWANRPEQYSKEMDTFTPIAAGQAFSLAMAGCALYSLRLVVWRINSQNLATKP